ncbi:hypothetical protein GCM10027075_04650 [Streptomyces heilongjiangensis]
MVRGVEVRKGFAFRGLLMSGEERQWGASSSKRRGVQKGGWHRGRPGAQAAHQGLPVVQLWQHSRQSPGGGDTGKTLDPSEELPYPVRQSGLICRFAGFAEAPVGTRRAAGSDRSDRVGVR